MGNSGIIYNSSLLNIEYLIHSVEESVILNTQQFDSARKFSAKVDDVTFGEFYKIGDAITAPQFQHKF
jgi:hypothetical protein